MKSKKSIVVNLVMMGFLSMLGLDGLYNQLTGVGAERQHTASQEGDSSAMSAPIISLARANENNPAAPTEGLASKPSPR